MTVFGTSYFPSVEYLKEFCAAVNAVIDAGEHYPKQTFRNRCSLLNGNGQLDLSIPVIRPNGNKSKTGTVKVSHEINWRRDHWRTISAGYASAPYFEHYEKEIKELVFQETDLLTDFNRNCLSYIQQTLDLPFRCSVSQEYIKEFDMDFRSFQFVNSQKSYHQVHFGQTDFVPNLSILDALFCLGPLARTLIVNS
ncbi:WbqC family protein [Crocinitomicaceae bacterium]|nr:WbqC family protein [Crocinitomicaceae bacterium]MDC1403224.1 WbqC family protein [Crocinitomicaceae bacterium]